MPSKRLDRDGSQAAQAQATENPVQRWAEVHQALVQAEADVLALASRAALQQCSAEELERARHRLAQLRELDDNAYRGML